ncbi:MAG: SEC-C domain-containing protein [Planctomycetes bacterium]|nr:SEC-C domain-containing protein [Planctomycetota bacterium]
MKISRKTICDLVESKVREDPAYAAAMKKDNRWLQVNVAVMDTEAIIEKLRSFGVPFGRAQFEKDLRGMESADRLSTQWARLPTCTAKETDDDFLFLAAMELRKRLLPDLITPEALDDWMQEGYRLSKEGKPIEAARVWLKVWRAIQSRMTGTGHTTAEADDLVRGTQCVFNWCQDFQIELCNAGLKDPAFFRECAEYCRAFVETFSGEGDLLPGFRRYEVEARFAMGEREQAEGMFESLIREDRSDAWNYILWADQYWLKGGAQAHRDFARAEAIYLRALEEPRLDDTTAVHERLAEMYREWGKPDLAERHEMLAEEGAEDKDPGEPVFSITRGGGGEEEGLKVNRNAPCTCGSGKKFKKCCGRSR